MNFVSLVCFITFGDDELHKLFSSLKSNRSSGYDHFHQTSLKQFRVRLAMAILWLAQMLLKQSKTAYFL